LIFLQTATLDLNNNIDKNFRITYLYNEATIILANYIKNQDFLLQMLEMIESSPDKYNTYKLDDYDNEATPQIQIQTSITIEPIENKSVKFKTSEFVFDLIKWDPTIDKSQIKIGQNLKSEVKFNDFKNSNNDRNQIKYFKINETIVWDCDKKIDILTNGDYQKYLRPLLNQEIINKGLILKYVSNEWLNQQQDENSNKMKAANFVNSFKLISYNIMSRNNLKKSINETMKRAKHSAGLEPLVEIDRMHKIIDLFQTNKPDFILLQECEMYEEKINSFKIIISFAQKKQNLIV